jgi:hypothetical protein
MRGRADLDTRQRQPAARTHQARTSAVTRDTRPRLRERGGPDGPHAQCPRRLPGVRPDPYGPVGRRPAVRREALPGAAWRTRPRRRIASSPQAEPAAGATTVPAAGRSRWIRPGGGPGSSFTGPGFESGTCLPRAKEGRRLGWDAERGMSCRVRMRTGGGGRAWIEWDGGLG